MLPKTSSHPDPSNPSLPLNQVANGKSQLMNTRHKAQHTQNPYISIFLMVRTIERRTLNKVRKILRRRRAILHIVDIFLCCNTQRVVNKED